MVAEGPCKIRRVYRNSVQEEEAERVICKEAVDMEKQMQSQC